MHGEFSSTLLRFKKVVNGADSIEQELYAPFPAAENSPMPWLHLVELWDYYAPKRQLETVS